MEINKILPLTTSLPGVPILLDPSVSRVQKAAMIIFASATVIPAAIVTITLAFDGVYNAYHYSSFYFAKVSHEVSEEADTVIRESSGGGGGGFSSGKGIRRLPTLSRNLHDRPSLNDKNKLNRVGRGRTEEERSNTSPPPQQLNLVVDISHVEEEARIPLAQSEQLDRVASIFPVEEPRMGALDQALPSGGSDAPGEGIWDVVDAHPDMQVPMSAPQASPWLSYLRTSGNQRNEEKYSLALLYMRISLLNKFPDLFDRWKQLQESSSVYKVLEQLIGDPESPVGRRYADFHFYLRQALTDCNKEDMREVLSHICRSKFTGMAFYTFLESYLPEVLKACKFAMPQQLTFSTLAENIRAANQSWSNNLPFSYRQREIEKDSSKLLGTIGLWFDPSAGSNVSWVHSIQTTAAGKKILVLRHGTPTQDPGVVGAALREMGNVARRVPLVSGVLPAVTWASVVPEYEAHLFADKTKRTLYVNHQECHASGDEVSHGEGDRSQAIRDLEQRHENFHFLALPFDGPLWKNKEKPRQVDELCKLLCESIENQSLGFCLPTALYPLKEVHQLKIQEILKQIHQLYFSDKEFDNVREEKAFIMLFYSELKDYVKWILDVDEMVSACKDNKDRGNASTTVDMVKYVVKLGKEKEAECLKEIFFSVLGPFIIKNEAIVLNRLEFALSVIEHLASLSDEQKQQIRTTSSASGFQLVSQVVPKEIQIGT